MLFFKNKNRNKYSMPISKIRTFDRRVVKYACERDGEKENRIGGAGAINLDNNDFILLCDGDYMIRCDLDKVYVSELMNLSGIVIKGFDKITQKERTVIAYLSDETVRVERR